MAIGLSIFLITVGAIFRFGITVNFNSIDLHAIGFIIMLAGAALLLIQMFWIIRARAVSDQRSDDSRRHRDGDSNWYRDGDSYWYRNTRTRPTYRDTTYRGDDDTPPLLAGGQPRSSPRGPRMAFLPHRLFPGTPGQHSY